ncbi:MAG: GfdT protein, partial [Candidatus Sabulitectum sp.]|nr:GfdT protein [Candidatus Sabulitectum sp.]
MISGDYTRRAEVSSKDEQTAVTELAEKLHMDQMGGVIFFCSADYNLPKIAESMNEAFSCPVVGCTTAGEIGSTYGNGGIVGASFSSEMFSFHATLLESLDKIEFESMG